MSDDKKIDFQYVSWTNPVDSDLKDVIVEDNETSIPERWYNALPPEQKDLWKLKVSFKDGKVTNWFKWVGDGKPWIIGVTL